MRALILSDIHANLEALIAVLAHAAGIGRSHDLLWNLGDTVGYGASPNQVIDLVRPISSLTVRGNHDRVCCGLSSAMNFNPVARAAVEWTQGELTQDNTAWLRALHKGPLHPQSSTPSRPADEDVLIGGSNPGAEESTAPFASDPEFDPAATSIACAHGSPVHEDHYIVSLRDAWAPLQQMPSPLTFIGHTHIQGGFAVHGEPGRIVSRETNPAARPPGRPPGDWRDIRPQFFSRSRPESWSVRLSKDMRYLVNPGSVGQPRDGDWRAAFAIYDSESAEITFYRVPYDVTAAQGRILMAGLPERLAARLREGR